jgi:hypothetical protein
MFIYLECLKQNTKEIYCMSYGQTLAQTHGYLFMLSREERGAVFSSVPFTTHHDPDL